MQKQIVFGSLFLLFLCVFLLTFPQFPLLSPFRGFVQSLFSGPKATLFHLSSPQNTDTSEVESLKKENKKLLLQFAGYEELKLDNQALQNQFQDTTINSQKLLPADV